MKFDFREKIIVVLGLISIVACGKAFEQGADVSNNYVFVKSLAKTNLNHFSARPIEDHSFPPDTTQSDPLPAGFNPEKCTNTNLGAIYESFLAKYIVESDSLDTEISPIYQKLFDGMKASSVFDPSVDKWLEKYKKGLIALPVSDTPQMTPDERVEELKTGKKALLKFDFVLFHSRYGLGIPPFYSEFRNKLFEYRMSAVRGPRTDNKTTLKRNQYGIVKFDVPALEKPEIAPWLHWGRDACGMGDSVYRKSAEKLHIPLACGVSGSTNFPIWSLLAYQTELDEKEALLYVLSVWAGLCADGGHSLQEVLSAVKVIADYLKEGDPKLTPIPRQTVASLISITDGISIDGKQPGEFGKYTKFLDKITSPGFVEARSKAQTALGSYVKANCSKFFIKNKIN